MARKLPKLERLQAINEIVDMMIEGEKNAEIRKRIEAKYKVSQRSISNYMKSAVETFTETIGFFNTEALGVALARLNHIYASFLAKEDYRGALNAQKEIHELLGLKVQRTQLDQTVIYQSAVPEPDYSLAEVES